MERTNGDPHCGIKNPSPKNTYGRISQPESNRDWLVSLPNCYEQTLESDFGRLNIWSNNHPQTPLDGGVNPLIGNSLGGEGLNRQSSIIPANNHMGFDGSQRFSTVGLNNLESYTTTLSNSIIGTNETLYTEDCLGLLGYYNPYLQRKKQLPIQPNTQYSIQPFSYTNIFPIVSTNGFESNVSNIQNHQLHNRNLHENYHYLGDLSWKDLSGSIVAMAKDHYWSGFLQRKLDHPGRDMVMIFLEIIGFVGDLMQDKFGHHFIQKFFKVCNEYLRTLVIVSVTNTPFQLIKICLHEYGTRAVQKLVEHVRTPEHIFSIVSALVPGAVRLANDQNGHHVIEHCLIHFSDKANEHLLKVIADNCFIIATDKSGCCVLQKCVTNSQGEIRARLLSEIIANAIHLVEDPYGNYVVQLLLELKEPEVTETLLKQLEGSFVNLSRNKFASNVVEKCLKESSEEQSSRIIMELIRSPNASMLLQHTYANFVIQIAMSVSKGPTHDRLLNLVESNASLIRNNLYGKNVLATYEKITLHRVKPATRTRSFLRQ